MKWSTRIGTFAGIDVYVHATFMTLIAWVAFAHWQTEHSAAAALVGVAFILALFACVVLHEFGHALTARRFGIKTRDITLLHVPVADVMRRDFLVADASDMIEVAFQRLQGHECTPSRSSAAVF